MSVGVTVYTNDCGSLALTPRDERKAKGFAEGVQRALWEMYGDELIGVPEVELYCNNTTQEWDARIDAAFRRHGRFW